MSISESRTNTVAELLPQNDHAAELNKVCDEVVDDVYRSNVVLLYLQENSSMSAYFDLCLLSDMTPYSTLNCRIIQLFFMKRLIC